MRIALSMKSRPMPGLPVNPDVDTIIEIGGQDSKSTTLENKHVTFSIMNTVCAAGTGSFVEEQAHKMGCPLNEYSLRTENERSLISSDRCTVFMERDMNHYLRVQPHERAVNNICPTEQGFVYKARDHRFARSPAAFADYQSNGKDN